MTLEPDWVRPVGSVLLAFRPHSTGNGERMIEIKARTARRCQTSGTLQMETEMYKNILMTTDGSELANKGLAQGLELAKAIGAKVTVVTVTEAWMPMGVDAAGLVVGEYALAEEYEKAEAVNALSTLAAASKLADAAGVTIQKLHIPRRHPSDAIVETARTGAHDLIVMASHGRRGLDRLLLGSQTTEVLAHSAVPVLVVK